jgi:hypothetical protein
VEAVLQIAGFTKRSLAWLCGIAGLLAYNWWVLVPFKPGLMRSPDELFSNLEVTGQPYAVVMQRADVTAGILLMLAFVLAGSRTMPGARREWPGMVVFAMAGAIGGLFPQVCADSVSHACLSAEWHFQLASGQYVHDGAGVVEFAGITLALWLATRRTRGETTSAARAYRLLGWAALVAYPVLGVSYLSGIYGGVVEGVFFAGFTAMVLLQLAERLHRQDGHELSSDHSSGMMGRNSGRMSPSRAG